MTVSLIRCTIANAVRRPTRPVRPTSRPPPSAPVTPVPTSEEQCKDRQSRSRCDWPQSPSNILLIGMQRPDATRVAGFRTWQSLGRHVNKGEHGIAILAPCIYRADNGGPQAETPTPGRGADPAATSEADPSTRRILRGFKIVHVFDISQTDGEPLPDGEPTRLDGDAPQPLVDHLIALTAEAGYQLERGPCRGANGCTDFATHVVRVIDTASPAQFVKTLAHELGHIRADHGHRFTDYATSAACRGHAEVEAESIAYLVMAQAGLDASCYSVPYLAGWSGGDVELLRESMTHVVAVSRAIALPAEGHPAAEATANRPLGPGSPHTARSPSGQSLATTSAIADPEVAYMQHPSEDVASRRTAPTL
ncbi:ArdC-like ssDNA-binding domain-containing protein [Cellulomonas hominis]